MDYQWESLGPDRFQEFCQALLARTMPEVLCFPIGQADGGRDAILYQRARAPKEYAVFQVKFTKSTRAQLRPHQWVQQTLKAEIPKLKRLIPDGATRYYLLTNTPGTSSPTAGSIDVVQGLISDALGIEGFCWWRDDLNRRLDCAPELKWSFPELLTGMDALYALINQGSPAEAKRRSDVVRMFVRTQHDAEEEVRFKQVELENKLLDLFVDVPTSTPTSAVGQEPSPAWERTLQRHRLDDDDDVVGAATLLLSPVAEPLFPQLVLEGAPGQGKSTITQYVCQVHRMRLLALKPELDKVPVLHKSGRLRLPIRADLRDLAAWLGNQDPFAASSGVSLPSGVSRSLDAFLSALIGQNAGGSEFSVEDLHETLKTSAVLLVLDGFDEIADIQRRQAVIGEIQSATGRLRELALSLQVVVTSRPSAFANSPGFPIASFPHCHLTSLTPSLIELYADKWTTAKKLSSREAAEVKRILAVKLMQPHLLALAKNPMQLAILLSLIHTRGESLPDKRTNLYDTYVDLFFSREAGKSQDVREHRELLTDLHRFLGWYLHCAAEKGTQSGSIGSDQLKSLLRAYLEREGRDPNLADRLFTGMMERVVFLVSRVQGTVEFEVQPLREYFAARYLYETAPYSPAGAEQKGTKPDRFDGLARNFYWLNVTRFFAGCFSKGELPGLVDRIQVLEGDEEYARTGYPRRLAAMLLSDWVFSQDQHSMRKAVRFVTEGVSSGQVLGVSLAGSGQLGAQGTERLLLPHACGGVDLAAACQSTLQHSPPLDRAWELVRMLEANATRLEIDHWWQSALPTLRGRALTRWLTYGMWTGAIEHSPAHAIRAAQQEELATPENLDILVKAGAGHYVAESAAMTSAWVAGWRRRVSFSAATPNPSDVLSSFTRFTDPYRLAIALEGGRGTSLSKVIAQRYGEPTPVGPRRLAFRDEVLRKCVDVIGCAKVLWERDVVDWAEDPALWNELVEVMRSALGESVCAVQLALTAAATKNAARWAENLGGSTGRAETLCRTVAESQIQGARADWWSATVTRAASSFDKLIVLAALHRFASNNVVLRLKRDVASLLEGLDGETWDSLIDLCGPQIRPRSRRASRARFTLPQDLHSPRFAVFMNDRCSSRSQLRWYLSELTSYRGDDRQVLEWCARNAIAAAEEEKQSWDHALDAVHWAYQHGVFADFLYWRLSQEKMRRFPVGAAQRIAAKPGEYSRALVYAAQERCRLQAAKAARRLKDVAIAEDWFNERTVRQ